MTDFFGVPPTWFPPFHHQELYTATNVGGNCPDAIF
jgi:hypothetical protein